MQGSSITTRDLTQALAKENGQFHLKPVGSDEEYVANVESGSIINIQRIGSQRENGWDIRRLSPQEADKLRATLKPGLSIRFVGAVKVN